jgi:DNA-binding GntR family transcriptional regulator
MTRSGKGNNKKQQAYEFIRSQITSGSYGPGYRIVIDRVAQELGTSSIPVREALQQLEAEGLIQNIPYSGAVVQLLNEVDYQETMFVLAILEGASTALAAPLLTQDDIKELEDVNMAMRTAFEALEFEKVGEYNLKFHAVIDDKCGNAFLVEKIRQTFQRILQIRSVVYSLAPQRAKISIEQHELLLRLLKERAPASLIEEFVRHHTQGLAQAVHAERK